MEMYRRNLFGESNSMQIPPDLVTKISDPTCCSQVATVEPSVTLFVVENLREKSEYKFRISAENEVGSGDATETSVIKLPTHASKWIWPSFSP